ncbi:unnamed protein product, partial [Iphiclides podalirius]
MSRLLCCLRARRHDMGAALSQPQEGEACDGAAEPVAPPTMADVIRERKKKAGGAALGTLRRRIVAAARRPRDSRPDRGCEHGRFIRSVVSSWRLAEVFVLCEQLEAGAALRDLATQAELAREPAAALHADLAAAHRDGWWCDVELVGAGWSVAAHRAVLAARCSYFRELLQRYPNLCRVPLEGVGASLSKEEAELAVLALYAGPSVCRTPPCDRCCKWERSTKAESDLDIISGESTLSRRGAVCGCSCGGGGGGGGAARGRGVRRLAELLGFSLDTLHRDMKYLLDSGEQSDMRLVFRLEGCGAAYGFRAALELPCHRLVLAARSRFFRGVLSRGGAGGAVCADERVLPRRFARALLHAAYTDQVDLGLIGRGSSSPSSTGSTGSGPTAWGGVSRSSPRPTSTSALDDAFQLYEIARFLEMAIAVQGCEDAIAEALAPDTLAHVLRWAAQPHASPWVHRQAMRYLRDEFPAVMAHAASARLPRQALAAALASPFLQASEAQALRALLRWAERAPAPKHAPEQREPNVVWHTAHAASRRGARRREAGEGALREALAALLPLVRLEHLPPDCELVAQALRRGALAQPPSHMLDGGGGKDAWLARGAARPPRCFLPYLDEIKALLEDQAVPEAELARVRRARYLHRIPDTLYMVAAARNGAGSGASAASGGGVGGGAASGGGVGAGGAAGAEALCVSPRVLGSLRARVRELRAAPPALRALELHASDPRLVHQQIALRAVREMSLPDSCAELLLDCDDGSEKESAGEEGWECAREEWGEARGPSAGERRERHERRGRRERRDSAGGAERPPPDLDLDCCRSAGGSLRSAGSARPPAVFLQAERDTPASCRRELPPRPDAHRSVRARLSACVPDVAMAPNANTHLLTARDYIYAPHQPQPQPQPHQPHQPHLPLQHQPLRPPEYGGAILQLDLGDGATHTPRPGSRAQRNAGRQQQQRDSTHSAAQPSARARSEDEELRAAIELSVMRAYSSLAGASAARCRPYADLLPHEFAGVRSRATPSPSALSAGSVGNVGVGAAGGVGVGGAPGVGNVGGAGGSGAMARRRLDRLTPPPRLSLGLAGAASLGSGSRSATPSPTPNPTPTPTPNPTPRRPRDYAPYRHHDYR